MFRQSLIVWLAKNIWCLASALSHCLHWERNWHCKALHPHSHRAGHRGSTWSSCTDTSLARGFRAVPSAPSSVLGQKHSRRVRLILTKAVSGLWAGEGRRCRAWQCQLRAVWHRQRHRGAARATLQRLSCPVTVIYLLLFLLPPSPCSSLPCQL